MELCREGLNLSNVQATRILRGKVNLIIVYACAAAQTVSENRGTIGDGWRFCQELSTYTNTPVIASTHTQRYDLFVGKFGSTWDYISTSGRGVIHYGH